MDLHLNSQQVREMIKTAEREGEVIVIRCQRKTKASKPGGPDVGDYYDLHCTTKPEDYVRKTAQDREAQDEQHGVLTVWVTNRQDPKTKQWGMWRRVNIDAVKKVIYKGAEYEVSVSPGYTGMNK